MSEGATLFRAWLGLGGNMDDPVAAMASALQRLDARHDTQVRTVSPVYRTPPWGKTDQDWFHNACAYIETGLKPLDLITVCLDIETALKRVRSERWGPRSIDIDILVMEDDKANGVIMNEQRLELPHPRIEQRSFVLVPLNDIAPDLRVRGKSVAELEAACEDSQIEKVLAYEGWWRKETRV